MLPITRPRVHKVVCRYPKSFCKCKDCGKLLNRTKRDVSNHKCGEKMCRTCQKFVNEEHQCFMLVPKKNESRKRKRDETEEVNPKILFLDFECTQERGLHIPNLVVVQDEERKEWIFHNCEDFCKWLFDEMAGVTCIAHNFKAYDSYFILDYLYKHNARPVLIMNGEKIMELKVPDVNVRFIDSINFFTGCKTVLPVSFSSVTLLEILLMF